jgi:hypothetical protein
VDPVWDDEPLLDPLPVSHFATPPWCEHVPEWCCEKLYVPSRQRAVAPGGGDAEEGPASAALPASTPSRAAIRTTRNTYSLC